MNSESIMHQTEDDLTKIVSLIMILFGFLYTKRQNYFNVIEV